jgi:hypothetical protein
MIIRAGLLVSVIVLLALPAFAVCSAEYSGDQCAQIDNLDGADSTSGGGGDYCPYYLCGNATGKVQTNLVWCQETGNYQDCPIAYCEYQKCIGSNCTPTTITCTACASKTGNNVHESACPRM